MPLTRRYEPEFAPGESCLIGYDFSPIIPVGVGIVSGALQIFTNTATPVAADTDFQKGPVQVQGRAIYASLRGGVAGRDYQLAWSCLDTLGAAWSRVGLMLCALTS